MKAEFYGGPHDGRVIPNVSPEVLTYFFSKVPTECWVLGFYLPAKPSTYVYQRVDALGRFEYVGLR